MCSIIIARSQTAAPHAAASHTHADFVFFTDTLYQQSRIATTFEPPLPHPLEPPYNKKVRDSNHFHQILDPPAPLT